MYTLKIQPVFQPMQTTLFKRAHTGACMDNGYDMSALEALSAFFQINNLRRNEQTGETNLVTQKDSIDMNTQLPALTNQICENLKTANSTNNLSLVNTVDKNLFDKYALTYYQQLKLQNEMPNNFFTQNSTNLQLARAFQLASAVQNSEINQQSTKNNQRLVKRQKIIPDPLQLVHSNLNLNNEQVQPLDLSLKSASSTNSEHFILEPINLSRSNSPQDIEKFNSEKLSNDTQINNSLVQIQNAFCKKKKIMAQQAELLKQSSCLLSASSSPSSSPTSSPMNQKFDLEETPINLETLVTNNKSTIATSSNNSTNKKRKLDESNLDSTVQHNIIGTNTHYKLKAKRRVNKRKISDSLSNDSQLESSNSAYSNILSTGMSNLNNGQAGTIIINAKNTFTCSICREMFAFKDRLSKHIKSKHRSKNSEESATLKSNEDSLPSSSLQQPSNGRTSPNQKSYLCTICNRSFARSDMLTRHSRVHSGVKPYTCDICDTHFTRSDHLATHKRTHSGEKPYLCSLCDYKACRRDMITRHMKTHSVKNKSTGVVLLLSNNKCSNSNSSTLTNSFSPQASNVSQNNSYEPKIESRSETESSEEEKNIN